MHDARHTAMSLKVCPDTVHGHTTRIKEINQRISELQVKSDEIESEVSDLQCRVSASDRLSQDACSRFGNIFVTSTQPYDDFLRNWSLGQEMLRLIQATETLKDQKLLKETARNHINEKIVRLRDQAKIHAECIEYLGH